jgi:hypothetical protein
VFRWGQGLKPLVHQWDYRSPVGMDEPLAHPLPSASGWQVWLWLLRRRRRFRVTGDSMLPLLQPGQEVLVDLAAYRQQPPQAGDIVVAYHPQQPQLPIVKRVLCSWRAIAAICGATMARPAPIAAALGWCPSRR